MQRIDKFHKITVCLDMAGCPNRCKHCWIGISDTKPMSINDMTEIAGNFRRYATEFSINSWYREPDFRADYRELFDLENRLSTQSKEHYELASFWRIVRDDGYSQWLYDIGVRKCQLTLFGDEETTDFYIGRKGAYKEIILAMDILLAHGIAPRIQLFVNQQNISKMDSVETLLKDMQIEKRCRNINQSFELFVHAGSCDGENEKLYDIRVETDDLMLLPDYIVYKTLDYIRETGREEGRKEASLKEADIESGNTKEADLKQKGMQEVFGQEERGYTDENVSWDRYSYTINESPVFYINGNFDVYPNETTPYSWWKIGNLLTDGYENILNRYRNGKFFAAEMIRTVEFDKMVSLYGNAESKKLFLPEDYYYYIVNQYLKMRY